VVHHKNHQEKQQFFWPFTPVDNDKKNQLNNFNTKNCLCENIFTTKIHIVHHKNQQQKQQKSFGRTQRGSRGKRPGRRSRRRPAGEEYLSMAAGISMARSATGAVAPELAQAEVDGGGAAPPQRRWLCSCVSA
jgi:hypothetical protein